MTKKKKKKNDSLSISKMKSLGSWCEWSAEYYALDLPSIKIDVVAMLKGQEYSTVQQIINVISIQFGTMEQKCFEIVEA